MDTGDPAFPRAAASWWYGCKGATKGTLGNISDDSHYRGGISSASEHKNHKDDFDTHVDDLILDAGEPRINSLPETNLRRSFFPNNYFDLHLVNRRRFNNIFWL